MVQWIALATLISLPLTASARTMPRAVYRYEPIVGNVYVAQNGGAFSITLGFRDKKNPDHNLSSLEQLLREPNPYSMEARVARFYTRTSEAILNANVDDPSKTEAARLWLLKRVRTLPGVFFAGDLGEMTTK